MASRKRTTKRARTGLRLLLPVLLLLVAAGVFAAGGAALTRSGASGAPSISSDKADYTPGETVTLTGANWQPGESVHILVNDDEGQSWSRDVDVTAGADGTLSDQFQLPNWFVASYSVTATGAVSGIATTSFTDGNVSFALATADTVNPGTWTVSWTKYDGANCVTSQSTGTTAGPGNAGVGNNKSLKPTGVTPAAGYTFTYWSTTATGTSPAANVCTNDADTPRTLFAHFQPSNTAPTTPGTPAATANPNNGAFTLDWTASTDTETPGAVTYTLERKTSGGSTYATVASGLTANSYTFSPGSKEGEGSWQYRVRASDGTLFSNYSADSAAIVVDRTPPTITFVSRTGANANGWNNGDVTVNWSCSDPGGTGVISPNVSQTVTTEGANQPATGTCTDLVGNTSSNRQTGINIDKTPPAITASATAAGNPYTSGTWTSQTVTVHFTCSDPLSGIAPGACPADVVVSSDTAALGQDVGGNVADRAGNGATSNTINVKVDKTAPTIAFVSRTPANGNGWNNGDVTVQWNCSTAAPESSAAA